MMKLVHKFFPRIGMLIVLPLLALSALMLNAQQATEEPTPSEQITAEATESPIPTDMPTESPTLEIVTPDVTEEATAIPATEIVDETQAPETGIAPEPPFSLIVREMLD